MSDDHKIIHLPADPQKEARRRIREAAESEQTSLDLGDLGLDALPQELGCLTNLRHLWLGQLAPDQTEMSLIDWSRGPRRPIATFTDLSPLTALTNLQSLDLTYVPKLQDLSPLSSVSNLQKLNLNQCVSISDLRPLTHLKSLISLDLSRCASIPDLRSLASLTGLNFLELGYGGAKMLKPEPLANLVNLVGLNLHFCKELTSISFLADLKNLEYLGLHYCLRISNLAPIASLNRLKHLYITGCVRVDSLDPLSGLSNLVSLHMDDCTGIQDISPLYPLDGLEKIRVSPAIFNDQLDIPDYLIHSEDAPSILAWSQEMDRGDVRRLSELKVLILGQGRVGKSHLLRRLAEEDNAEYHDARLDPTQNIDCLQDAGPAWIGDPKRLDFLKIRFLDFGGQNHLHSAHRFFLGSERCVYLLVLAADRPANGEEPLSNRLNYWLRMIAWYGQNPSGEKAPAVIIITRNDVPAASIYRQQINDAIQSAERHGWFGAKVIQVVRGMGWSRSLDRSNNSNIWNEHRTAIAEVVQAIDDSIQEIPAFHSPVPVSCHEAKEFIEKAFSTPVGEAGCTPRPYLVADDLKAIDAQFGISEGMSVDERRRGARNAGLALAHSLGVAHWIGNVPEIMRKNPWGLKEVVFNPEWVKRPVYDLLWRSVSGDTHAGFLSDRQVEEVLAIRPTGEPSGMDLYERTAFTEEDRGRILELMKACRLIFDSPREPGILIPDLLETMRLTDDAIVLKSWRYSTEFLPEKIMLRFIAQQYQAIDTRTGHCFRNRVVWKRGEHEVVLEAHFSPPGGTRPYVLILPAAADGTVSESVAATVGVLLDEIFVDEGLGDVWRELRPVGEGRLDGQFVFRKLPPTPRDPKAKPSFSIIFDGVDLGSNWRFLTGLEYLHTLICHPGQPCFVRDLAPDNRSVYRFQQDAVEREPVSEDRFRKGGEFAEYSTKQLKKLLETAIDNLAVAKEKDEDEKEQQDYELQVEKLTCEIEQRDNPQMKKLMNTAQQHLKRGVDELKERMQENGISAADLEHFDHCTSSEAHPFHFCYRPASQVDWETD